jgi:hypothetical protein
MGPSLIFDKSFIQSLSIDESVWLDNFFISNICPIFFSETLADLEKQVRSGRTPEQEVRVIANKTPEMSISVNTFHKNICLANLNGYPVTMDRRPLISGGRPVESDNEKGYVFEPPPESLAFSRWQEEKFLDLEREYAKRWREETKKINYENFASICNQYNIEIPKSRSLEEAKSLAESILDNQSSPMTYMRFIFSILDAPPNMFLKTYYAWGGRGCPQLRRFAPYVYHVLSIEIFYHIAVNSSLIDSERKSNKIDISYLFYLPFCNIFVSTDKIHKRCATLFMGERQEFVWGPDLKNDLREIDIHFDKLPQETKDKGLHSFAAQPPTDGNFMVSKLWDTYLPKWRQRQPLPDDKLHKLQNSGLHQKMKRFANAEELPAEKVDFKPNEADAMLLKRSISRKKGKWYQIGQHITE